MTPRTPRIRIDDLSPLENLTEQELADIYGAGRRKKWEFSGQAMEVLEVRQVMSAVTVAIDGSAAKVTGSAGSDAVFVQRESGRAYVETASEHGLFRTELPDSVRQIQFDLGAGDDFVQIADAFWESGLTIDSGDGADLLAGLSGDTSNQLTTAEIDRLFTVRTQQEAGLSDSVVKKDADGNTLELTYRAGQLVSAITTSTTGTVSKVAWSVDGAVSRQTYNGPRPVLEEFWTTGGGYRRTDWNSDGSVVTRSFLKESLLQEETWQATTFTRTTWSGDGSRLQQTFQNDVLTREELAAKSGETIVTEHRSDGSVARENYVNGKLRVSDVVTSENRVRTAYAEHGAVIRQTFVQGQQTLEEAWTTEGGFRRTTFMAADQRVMEYFRNDQLVQKEEVNGVTLTRTAWNASGASLRQVYQKDVLVTEEQWGTDGTYSRKSWNSDGSSIRETYENGALRLREEWKDTTAVRTSWGTDGTELRQTWVDGRQTTVEARDTQKTVRKTHWNSDGSIVRLTSQDGKEVLREEWLSGKRYSRTAWSDKGDRYQESFVDGQQVSKEQWKTTGGYQTTVWTATETLRLTYQDKALRLRETWAENSLIRESWDEAGNWMKESLADGQVITRQQWARDGSSIRQSYSSTGALSREEKWGKDSSYQITNWSSTSTSRDTYIGNTLMLREVWEGKTQTRQVWDGKGNSGKQTWHNGNLSRDEKWTSAGVYQVTNWYSSSTVRQTIIGGRERLRDTWEGTTTTRLGWDGNGNSIRQIWSGGKQTSEDIWDTSGGHRRTTWNSHKSVWRQYYLNGRETFRQTWSSSGAYRSDQWKVPPGSGQYRGLTTPDSIRSKSDSLSSSVAGAHAKIASTAASVSVSGATEAADNASGRISGIRDNSASIAKATQALNPESFEQLKSIGRDWPSLSQVIQPNFGHAPARANESLVSSFIGASIVFDTHQQLRELQQFDPVAAEAGTYLQSQELESISSTAESIRAAIEAFDISRFPDLLARLAVLESAASTATRPMISELRQTLSDAMQSMEESAIRSKEWNATESTRLTESARELQTQRSALEKLIQEYNAALVSVKKELEADRILRSQTSTNSTTPTTLYGGRGGLGAYNPNNKATPEYIDPNAPEHNLPGRIAIVYDKVLVITQQLRSSLNSLLEGSDRGLAAEVESIIQALDAGKAAYVQQTESASVSLARETSRIATTTENEKARVTSQAATGIEAANRNTADATAPYEKSKTSLEKSRQDQIAAAARERDKVVGPSQTAISNAEMTYAREIADARSQRDQMASGNADQGFGLYSTSNLKSDLGNAGGAAGDWIQQQGEAASDWVKEQQRKASEWYKGRESEILQARDKVINDANAKIRDAKQKFDDAKQQIEAAFKAPLSAIQKQLDRLLAERDKAIDKLTKERDSALSKWDAWEAEQQKKLLSTYNKGISEARDQVFADGGAHLQSVLSKVTNLQSLVTEDKNSMMARNPFGVLADIEKTGLQQVQSLGQHAASQLAAKIADLSAAIQKSTQQHLSAMAKYSTDRWTVVSDYSSERWVAFKNASATRWHDTLEKLDAGWKNWEDFFSETQTRRVTQIAVEPFEGAYRIAIEKNRTGVQPRGIEWVVTFNGEIVHSEYTIDADSVIFSAPAEGLYKIAVNLKDKRNEYSNYGGYVSLPISERTVIYGKKDLPVDTGAGSQSDGDADEQVSYDISDAEKARGFALPYLLSSSGMFVDSSGQARLGVGLIEATDQTSVSAYYQRVNASGEPVDYRGQTREEHEIWKTNELKRLEGIVDRFELWRTEVWNYQNSGPLAGTYENYAAIYGAKSKSREQWTREIEDSWGQEGGSDLNWSNWYAENFPGEPTVTYHAARHAVFQTEYLRQYDWQSDDAFVIAVGTDQLEQGLTVPSKVTTGEWTLQITTQEKHGYGEEGSKPEVVKSADRLSKDFFSAVFSSKATMENWKQFRASYIAPAVQQASSSLKGIVKSGEYDFSYFASRLDSSRFKSDLAGMEQDFRDAFGIVPFWGVFADAGNVYVYAKEGNIKDASVSAAGMLMNFLPLGRIAAGVTGKIADLVQFGGKEVLRLDKSFLEEGADAVASTFRKGINEFANANLGQIVKKSGLSADAARYLQKVAADHDVLLAVRPRSEGSFKKVYVYGTHHPKSEILKMKTIKEADQKLGVNAQVDEIAVYNPQETLLKKYPEIKSAQDIPDWLEGTGKFKEKGPAPKEVREAYSQRFAEYKAYEIERREMLSPQGMRDADGVIYRMDATTGVVTGTTPDGITKRIAGDSDLYAILDRATGKPLQMVSTLKYHSVLTSLKLNPAQAMHGDHLHWKANPEYEGMRTAIDKGHMSASAGGTSNAERLAVFDGSRFSMKYVDEIDGLLSYVLNRNDWLK